MVTQCKLQNIVFFWMIMILYASRRRRKNIPENFWSFLISEHFHVIQIWGAGRLDLQILHFVNILQLVEQFFGGRAILGAMGSTFTPQLPIAHLPTAPEADLAELCTQHFITGYKIQKIEILSTQVQIQNMKNAVTENTI